MLDHKLASAFQDDISPTTVMNHQFGSDECRLVLCIDVLKDQPRQRRTKKEGTFVNQQTANSQRFY